MKSTGIQLLKKLGVLLAVLLFGMLAIAIPVSLQAAPTAAADQPRQIEHADEASSLLMAGEVSSGEVEAVLLLDKSLLAPLFYSLLHLYPNTHGTAPAPSPCAASKDDRRLHTILTKGP